MREDIQRAIYSIEKMWEDCQDRNIGSNEAELDFVHTLAEWHVSRMDYSYDKGCEHGERNADLRRNSGLFK